jgi:hypothetical protein
VHTEWSSLRKILYAAIAVIGTAIALTIYVDHQISLAEIVVESRPVVAARDLPALLKIRPIDGGSPTEGQTSQTSITENTKCRLLPYEPGEWCLAGRGNPVKRELLEGPRRSQVARVCSNQIRRLHPLP